MKVVHIIGHQGCGKTTLMVDLVKDLTFMGYEVGTLKHSSHYHELDKKGKDSHKHRTAGAALSSIVTENMIALYMPRKENHKVEDLIEKYHQDIDILLIEGWISGPFKKIETWRLQINITPLFFTAKDVVCIVSDDIEDLEKLVNKEKQKPALIQRNKIKGISDFIVSLPDV